jgi:hypothetical protein
VVFEAKQPALFTAWQQHRQTEVLMSRPELLSSPILHLEERHGMVPGPLERFAPIGLVDGPESNEPRNAEVWVGALNADALQQLVADHFGIRA